MTDSLHEAIKSVINNSSVESIRSYARTFPSQGGVEIGPWLEQYAAQVPEGAAIVEVGCWLGAGTAWLALGAMKSGAVVHTYDRFTATAEEVEKAAKFGVMLKAGATTLPYVLELLKPITDRVIFHTGNIKDMKWTNGPIGLYCDDATKIDPLWLHAMDVFKPHFIKGKTVLVLMDYFYHEKATEEFGSVRGQRYAAQKRYMKAHAGEFELLGERMGGTTTAVFRYI